MAPGDYAAGVSAPLGPGAGVAADPAMRAAAMAAVVPSLAAVPWFWAAPARNR